MDYLLLPRRIDYDRYPPGDPICDQWIRAPGSRPGQTFLITMDADVSTQIGAPHGFGLCVPDEREAGEELPAIALGDIDTLVSQDFDNCFL